MEIKVLEGVSRKKKLDLILCLGKNLNPDNSLDWILQARIAKAAEIAREHPEAMLVFSGGKYFLADYSVSEADAMCEYVKTNYPDIVERIIIEDKGDNTIDQLCRLKKEFIVPNKIKSIALVSDELHTRRAFVFLDGILGDGYEIFPIGAHINISGHARRAIDEIEDTFLQFSKDTVASIKRGDEEAYRKHNARHKSQTKKRVAKGATIIESLRRKN